MKLRQNKKGVLDNLGGIITALGYIAIVLAVMFLVLAQIRSSILSNAGSDTGNIENDSNYGLAWNATEDVTEAMMDVPPWLPIVVITVIGGVLLTLVSMFRKGK